MMPGETISTGARPQCEDCHNTSEFKVCRSPAGYYIGTYCDCGPYSRESDYYKTEKQAEEALKNKTFKRS